MRFIEGDAGGSLLEGARDLPVFFLQNQGDRTGREEKMWGTFAGIAFAGLLALLFEREGRRHH
jgi:hypothetical protein